MLGANFSQFWPVAEIPGKLTENCQMSTADFVALARRQKLAMTLGYPRVRASSPFSLSLCTLPKSPLAMFFTGLGIVLWAANTLVGHCHTLPVPPACRILSCFPREILLGKLLWKVLTHDLRVRRQCQRQHQHQRRLHLISYLCGAHSHPLGHAHFLSARLRRDLCGWPQSVTKGGRCEREKWRRKLPTCFHLLAGKTNPNRSRN